MKSWSKLTISLLLFLSITTAPASGEVPAPFSDIDPGDGNYVAISYLQQEGIIEGYADGTFRPYEKVNRAEAVKMLTLASGLFSEEEFENVIPEFGPFSDTPANEWYTPYLIAAKDAGIIEGYADDSYKPQQSVNLAEALKIYLESHDTLLLPEPEFYTIFADTPADAWFTPYTSYADARDMLIINHENKIFPEQEMTRGYLAEIIYRKTMQGLTGAGFGKATYYGAAVHGNNTASGEVFDMYQMTAAHKTLPFGTVVRVTNLANGKQVEVTITDRGPYGPGRVIDLTSSAFEQIAELWQGVIHVQYEVVSTP